MKSKARAVIFVMLGIIMVSTPALSQITSGTITGRILDPSGAPIPNANVTLTDIGTEAKRAIVSSDQGEYTFLELPPGTYALTAQAKGFGTLVQQDIQVRVNEAVRVELTLKPSTVEQTVNVESTAPEMQTESAATGGVVDHTDIVNLPLNGRNFIQLVALEPGVASTAKLQGGGEDYTTSVFGGNYTVNGAPGDGSSYMFDGIEMRDAVDTRVAFQPTLEMIQEFNFQATNYSAAFGRSAGGIVNLVSRSGTDQFHGSVWEYLRNDVFDGKNFFASTRSPFRQNQFGGALGGPIRRGKTFFYVTYEGFRQSKGITSVVTVPTAAERTGDFSAGPPIFNPNSIDPSTGLREPFPGNIIPPSLFSPVAVKALSLLFPSPNLPGSSGNLLGTATQTIISDQVNVRIDQKLGTADSLSGRYTILPDVNRNFPFVFSSLPNFSSVWDSPAQNFFIGETHTFGTSAVNEFRVGFNRNTQILQDPQEGTNIDAELGITGVTTQTKLLRNPNINIAGLAGTGSIANAPNNRTDNENTVLDNFTRTKGRITYSAGVSIVRIQDNGGANSGDSGIFNFTGTFTGQLTPALTGIEPGTGNAVADFLLGYPGSSQNCCVTGNGFRNFRKTDFGTFFQVDWKVRPNLTVNLGARYEIFEAPYDTQNRIGEPDLAAAPAAVLLLAGQNGVPRGFYNAPKHDVSPRIGLAYSLNSKTVLRGGYGIFYLDPQLINAFAMSEQLPFTELNSFVSSPIVPQLTLADAFPAGLGLPSETFNGIALNYRDPYMQAYNVTVQRDLGFGTTLTVAYVGTKGSDLTLSDVPGNAPPPGPGPLSARRPIPGFGSITIYNNDGYSNYNSLQLKAEKHFTHNFSFLGSYAWSKCIDDGATGFTYGGNISAIRNPADGTANRGLCDQDIRNRVVFNTIYQLPFGNRSAGFLKQVEAGWALEGILTLEAGQPFSVLYPLDNSNTGILLDTPDLVAGQNPNNGPKTPNDWFNLNAFTAPVPFTFGTAGRNIVIGPPLKNLDFSVHKQFLVTERQALEFRAEFFNVTNHTNFFQPGNTFGTPSLGVIGGAFDPRDIQFSLKYNF